MPLLFSVWDIATRALVSSPPGRAPQVTALLKRYLGDYVENLDKEKLKISVWRGDVVLRNLQLKPGALRKLNLPVVVESGVIGTLTLKVRLQRRDTLHKQFRRERVLVLCTFFLELGVNV